MANNRIFYACQAVALAPCPTDENRFGVLHGVQSVGINTSFNLEQIFELGQISIYENIEGLPDVELTIERVLDGYPLAYRLATRRVNINGSISDPGNSLVERTKNRCSAALAIYPDDKVVISGTPPMQVYMSGMYVNSISYTLPVDGNCTESITLVGNHKVWKNSTDQLVNKFKANLAYPTAGTAFNPIPSGGGFDIPKNLQPGTIAGGVQRRENVVMVSSIVPRALLESYGLYDVATDGSGNNWNADLKVPKVHIQNIAISTDLGREDILELGQKAPYYRAPNFPVEVTCEFEVISISGDMVYAYEEGNPAYIGTVRQGDNTSMEQISIMLSDGTKFNLGNSNRLSSVTYGGGDAGGGNSTSTFSYVTYNDLYVDGPHLNWGEAIA
jgi:hypothetical protein